jgi:lysozyme
MTKNRNIIIFTLVMMTGIGCLLLVYFGYLWPNNFFAARYPVKGIDVSNHQKVIDWQKIDRNEDIAFVFMKATEGNDYQDKYFAANWAAARDIGLLRGAYHYFTTASSGLDQADNFISLVPVEKGCLPPVIDIEVRGTGKAAFKKELSDFIGRIEETYHQTPILYVVYSIYDEYIQGEFNHCPVWIRDIIDPPVLSDNREWLFWQYSSRGRIGGIDSFVDMDVFRGDLQKLESLRSK